ncbi:MAG: two-component regulator propeller domain-containing protein, partial [Bacteroidota bacterium]
MRLFFLFIGITIWGVVVLPAQHFHVMAYDEDSGLPSNVVRHVVQDTFGFLWLASDNGLLRFDGQRFQTYSEQVPSQYGRYFQSIGSSIWYSHDAGLSQIFPAVDSGRVELMERASIDPNDEKALYYPNQLLLDDSDQLWLSQANGEVLLIGLGDILKWQVDQRIGEEPAMVSLASSPDGQVWLGGKSGLLYRYDYALDSLIRMRRFKRIDALHFIGQNLWVGGEKLYNLSLSKDGKRIIGSRSYSSPEGVITAIAADQENNIYLGIEEKGLYLFPRNDPSSRNFVPIYSNNDPNRVDELPFKNIHQIEWSREGQLLICSSEGFGILQKRFFETIGNIPNSNVNGIAIGQDKDLLVNFGDVYHLQPRDYGYEGDWISDLNEGNISSVAIADREFWIGTSSGKLLRLGPRKNSRSAMATELIFPSFRSL